MTHITPSLAILEERGFYPDLTSSMHGFMQKMHDEGKCALGQEITEQFAAGYLGVETFSFDPFRPESGDPFFELKVNFLSAMEEIFQRFHDRMPRQFYATLAFLGTRVDPTIEDHIPEIEDQLPDDMKWQIADTMLHALGICYRLSNDVQTIINRHTGHVLGHGCACGCQMQRMEECVIRAAMGSKPECIQEETESFLRHGLGQNFLLQFGLPQGMGKAQRLQNRDMERIRKRTATDVKLHTAHNVGA